MRDYLQSRTVRIGLAIVVVGAGPLFSVLIAAKLGLTKDPNPNPLGLGILAMLTFWPGLLTAAAVALRVWREKRDVVR